MGAAVFKMTRPKSVGRSAVLRERDRVRACTKPRSTLGFQQALTPTLSPSAGRGRSIRWDVVTIPAVLLTVTTARRPATDLGFLLHKNPARPQAFDLAFGRARVFYPEATEDRCTVALLLEVDPVGLVRNRRGPAGEGFALQQYVHDRPYVASSFLSVAIARVFGSALAGTSRERPELARTPIPLQ